MKITTINIQAAGLPRARHLLRWLDQRDDDLVILTETSRGPGTTYLLDSSRDAGWDILTGPRTDRGCAILSRHQLERDPAYLAGSSLPDRALAATLATQPTITVVGLYVPSNDRRHADRKRTFLNSISHALHALPPQRRSQLIVAGDLNLIPRDHQPPYPGVFAASDYAFLDTLATLGLLDVHRELHPDEHPHSWIGHRGHAYRYDYILLSAALAPRVSASTYLHEVRLAGLSDHAAVSVELDLASSHLPKAGPLAAGTDVTPGTRPAGQPLAGASHRSG